MGATEISSWKDDSSAFLKAFVLVVLVSTAIGLMATVFIMQSQQSSYDKRFVSMIGKQRELSLSLVTDSLEAAGGAEAAYSRLTQARDEFDQILADQNEGSVGLQIIDVRSPLVTLTLQNLDKKWSEVRAHIDTILDGRGALENAGELVSTIEQVVPDIQILADEVSVALIETGASDNDVYIATRQLLLLQRLENNVSRLVGGGIETASAADRFGRDMALFATVLEGMLEGQPDLGIERVNDPEIRALLDEMEGLFASVESAAEKILLISPELFRVVSASEEIVSQAAGLRAAVDDVSGQFSNISNPREKMAFMFGILAAVLLVGVAIWQIFESRARAKESEARNREVAEQNERNQEAILTLLDEMGDLADGDLTVTANVTESLTGAIADSVNYAIEALRELVTTINTTSVQVAGAARETSSVAEHVEETSRVQTQQILSATESVDSMAQSMNEMSTGAGASAEVASSSVQLASQGGDRVRRTIQGMDVIREHIQETSKRIKRLGESSQEIGDIVGLINDIADQTNILALNAAIQAAAAGESGRGFAVVADEVQRLAERAGNSTKRIEQLVKTIQADTSEAVISMEKSTAEVVNGADLAERAGESLEEIENVSNKLADLINDMSRSARDQAEVAQAVSSTMENINELTGKAADGTTQTARSVERLTEMSEDMRKSVAGFKLPEDMASAA